MTTVQNLKTMRCAYGISLTAAENNFTVAIDIETIKYHDDTSFYHVNTSVGQYSKYEDDTPNELQTELLHGRFEDNLDQLSRLYIPYLNISKINTINQLITKIKLLTVMSP